jgi:hypothetical protein
MVPNVPRPRAIGTTVASEARAQVVPPRKRGRLCGAAYELLGGALARGDSSSVHLVLLDIPVHRATAPTILGILHLFAGLGYASAGDVLGRRLVEANRRGHSDYVLP